MKKIIVAGMLIMSAFFIVGCGCDKKEEKKEIKSETKESLNTNKGIIKEQTVEGITFKNAILLLDGEGMSNFKITLENTSGNAKHVETFKVTFIDKEGTTLLETYGYVGYELANGENTELMISLDQDMKNAYEVKYELLK